MAQTEGGWQVLSDDLLVYEYSIGSGNGCNAVAFRLEDGGLGVISPPARFPDTARDALATFGEVSALIAPNAFHNLGLPKWQARFPEAGVYAGETALPRLRKRLSDLEIQPVSALADALPEGSALIELPRMKNGETWLRAPLDGQVAWYCGDVFVNFSKFVGPMGLFMRLVGMGPGFTLNPINRRIMMGDRAAVRACIEDLLAAHAPATIIPGHGDVLSDGVLAEEIRARLP